MRGTVHFIGSEIPKRVSVIPTLEHVEVSRGSTGRKQESLPDESEKGRFRIASNVTFALHNGRLTGRSGAFSTSSGTHVIDAKSPRRRAPLRRRFIFIHNA